MANKLIRRVFIIVILIVLMLIAALWFKYGNNSLSSSEKAQETAPLFLDPETEDISESDEQEVIQMQDEEEWDAEELEISDLEDAFEDDDFIKHIQNDAQGTTFNNTEDFVSTLPVIEHWVVKVADFDDEAKAQALIETLEIQGFKAFAYYPLDNQPSFVQVLVITDPEMTHSQAESLKEKLYEKGYTDSVLQNIEAVDPVRKQ